MEALRQEKPLVVVGTPGRLAEHSRTGVLQTHGCPILVLDEVMGFGPCCVSFLEYVGVGMLLGRQCVAADSLGQGKFFSCSQRGVAIKQEQNRGLLFSFCNVPSSVMGSRP